MAAFEVAFDDLCKKEKKIIVSLINTIIYSQDNLLRTAVLSAVARSSRHDLSSRCAVGLSYTS